MCPILEVLTSQALPVANGGTLRALAAASQLVVDCGVPAMAPVVLRHALIGLVNGGLLGGGRTPVRPIPGGAGETIVGGLSAGAPSADDPRVIRPTAQGRTATSGVVSLAVLLIGHGRIASARTVVRPPVMVIVARSIAGVPIGVAWTDPERLTAAVAVAVLRTEIALVTAGMLTAPRPAVRLAEAAGTVGILTGQVPTARVRLVGARPRGTPVVRMGSLLVAGEPRLRGVAGTIAAASATTPLPARDGSAANGPGMAPPEVPGRSATATGVRISATGPGRARIDGVPVSVATAAVVVTGKMTGRARIDGAPVSVAMAAMVVTGRMTGGRVPGTSGAVR